MKHIIVIALTVLSLNTVNAQVKNKVSQKDIRTSKPIYTPSTKMDLNILKSDMESQNRFYDVTITMAALTKSYKTTFPITAYAIEQGMYWEEASPGYFRTNAAVKRSKTFSSTNGYEVLIYPNRSDSAKVGKVYVTLRSSELGLNTFTLENVNVVYHKDGILINGTKTIKGFPMATTIVVCAKK